MLTIALLALVAFSWFLLRRHLLQQERKQLLSAMKPLLSAPAVVKPPSGTRIMVVTGGQGFLGQYIVEQAVLGGYYTEIRVLDVTGSISGSFKTASGVVVRCIKYGVLLFEFLSSLRVACHCMLLLQM